MLAISSRLFLYSLSVYPYSTVSIRIRILSVNLTEFYNWKITGCLESISGSYLIFKWLHLSKSQIVIGIQTGSEIHIQRVFFICMSLLDCTTKHQISTYTLNIGIFNARPQNDHIGKIIETLKTTDNLNERSEVAIDF